MEPTLAVIRGGGRPDTYKNATGKRVVSVTTVTGRYDNKESLIAWAAKEAREGRDYKLTRDLAASTGTAVHDAIERFVSFGAVADPNFSELGEEQQAQAMLAYRAFERWFASEQPTITHAEMPIVNERLQVAGTIDAFGILRGKRTLLDWKTSNGIYAGHVVQVAAYGLLWEESHDKTDWPEQYAILRFGKDGTLHDRVWTPDEMRVARDAFEVWLAAYRLDAPLQKLLRQQRQTETGEE